MNTDRTGTKLTFQLPIHDDVFTVGERVNLTFDMEAGHPYRIGYHESGLWEILWIKPAVEPEDRAFKVRKVS